MSEKLIEKLADRAPLAIIVIGVFVFIIGAVGGLPVGNPPLQITDPTWRIGLGTMGVVLALAGLLLQFRETSKGTDSARPNAPKRVSDTKSAAAPEQASLTSALTDPKLRNLVPQLSHRFRIIKLPESEPQKAYGISYAPLGLLMVNEVPFYLEPAVDPNGILIGHKTIDIQPGEHNAERIMIVPANVHPVSRVHFLLAAGHGWAEHQGVQFVDKRIGYIELVFADKSTQRANLTLGKDIREWAFGNSPELVKDINHDTTKPAWISHDTHYLTATAKFHLHASGGVKSALP